MEQVWALGWFVNRLLSQPPKAFTVVGVWGMALPSLVVVLALPVSLMAAASNVSIGSAMIGSVSLLMALCYLLLAVRVTRSYLRHRPRVRHDGK